MVRVAGALPGVKPLPPGWCGGGVSVALVPVGDGPGRLAGLLGCAAGDVAVHRDRGGKPLLSRPAGAAYSIAHRGGMSLVAAGWHRAIGADLELVREDLPLGEIAEACFSGAEAGWIRGLPGGRRALGFTVVWAVKEAVLKSRGVGIVGGMIEPAVGGDALMPLLAGAECLTVRVPGFEHVQVRLGTLGAAEAVACVAVGGVG